MPPIPPVLFLAPALSIHVVDHAARRYPQQSRHQNDSSNYVISQKQQNFIYINIFNDIPKSLDYILHGFLTVTLQVLTLLTPGSHPQTHLVAKPLYTRCPISQNIRRLHRRARLVDVGAATPLTRIHN